MTSRSARFEILSDVMLAWTPAENPEDDGAWVRSPAARWDIDGDWTGKRASWQLAVSHSREKRVGPGTVGWIHEWDGRGRIAAVMIFDSNPYSRTESATEVSWYADGVIGVIPPEDRVSAETIMAHPDWKPSAPYVGVRGRQFKDGAPVSPANAAVLRGLLDAETARWVAREAKDTAAR
ncbi:hypothetical protein LQ327_07335 [Actinomycetospora endophytica]|uniref:Uncharacterized protein n=1 Tax=Actinomycetospora endophytica TaxID=2291215 RepID=A0ABS8P590_9PSEU|nr:hypothetical protein [Actinomycetospora endophytica]MCD2193198.1 hypothetical protein [Actinomycetospora endophytica]